MMAVGVGLALAGWSEQSSGVTTTLYDIECAGAELVWAVGAGGRILHSTNGGENWAAQTSGTNQDLHAVDFVDGQQGWAVGAGPVILHTSDGGANWAAQSPGTSNNLLGVAFASPSRGWACGVSGTIVGTTDGGGSWRSEASGLWPWFYGLDAASPTRAWTIGGDWFNHVASIYHYNGSSWVHQYDAATTQDGLGMSAANLDAVWAVGGNGTIVHTTNGGTNWAVQTSGVTTAINAAAAVGANYCWVAGDSGVIRSTTDGGATWGPEQSGVTSALNGVTMLDTVVGWACGSGGVILRRSGGGQGCAETPGPRKPMSVQVVGGEVRVRLAGPESGRVSVSLQDGLGRRAGRLYSGPVRPELRLAVPDIGPGAWFVVVAAPEGRHVLKFVKVN